MLECWVSTCIHYKGRPNLLACDGDDDKYREDDDGDDQHSPSPITWHKSVATHIFLGNFFSSLIQASILVFWSNSFAHSIPYIHCLWLLHPYPKIFWIFILVLTLALISFSSSIHVLQCLEQANKQIITIKTTEVIKLMLNLLHWNSSYRYTNTLKLLFVISRTSVYS